MHPVPHEIPVVALETKRAGDQEARHAEYLSKRGIGSMCGSLRCEWMLDGQSQIIAAPILGSRP